MKSGNKSLIRKALPFIGAAAIAGTDLYIKKKMDEELPEEGTIDAQPPKKGILLFRRHHNKGAIMNIGSTNPESVKLASTVACGGVFGALFGACKHGSFWEKIGYMLCLGGAMSNTYDRVKKGYVMDYVSLDVKPKRVSKVVFNLSDICVFIGSVIVLINGIFSKRN